MTDIKEECPYCIYFIGNHCEGTTGNCPQNKKFIRGNINGATT
jgi:hypothetical protein